MPRLTFLGTGGGRFVTLTQERSTGGIYLEDGYKAHIDPGPGALYALKRARIDPTRTDVILISHCHPDHYANAEVLIEGMASSRRERRGVLISTGSVIGGKGRFGPAISRYHRGRVRKVIEVSPGKIFKTRGLRGQATPSFHSDPECVGFRLSTSKGTISYVADTELKDELVEAHMGSRVIILATTRPIGAGIPYHLSTEDAAEMASRIEPEICLLTHMGKKFLNQGPERQAEIVSERTGIKTVAARDGMVLNIGDGISIKEPRKRHPRRH